MTEQETIRFYRAVGEYGYLSNLYPCSVKVNGLTFASAEHAYQFEKPKELLVKAWIAAAPYPRLAAHAAHHLSRYDVEPNWEDMKLARMRVVVEAKFRQNEELRERLLSTGTATIQEDSPSDMFWGTGRVRNGRNWLGLILMEVRDKLRPEA